MTHRFSRFSLFTAAVTLLASHAFGLDYYVSPSGNDANAGTSAAPFATIAGAREAISTYRVANPYPAEGFTVYLNDGIYYTPTAITFDVSDSGTASAPIVYKSVTPTGAVITGAAQIPAQNFRLITSADPEWNSLQASVRASVYVADLPGAGVTDYGALTSRGFGIRVDSPAELFLNDHPMRLAQWPNEGAPMLKVQSVNNNWSFVSATLPARAWTASTDIWTHGLFGMRWADYHISVASVNRTTGTVALNAPPPNFGIGVGAPFVLYNILEELDAPNEYYLNRANGRVLFIPPTATPVETLSISINSDKLIQLSGASNIVFSGIVFDGTRYALAKADNAKNIVFKECLFRNAGGPALTIYGSNSGVDSSEIVDCGEYGVMLNGGDRPSLTNSGNFVTNNRIHRMGRLCWGYNPAVHLNWGCGSIVKNNLIDDLPHAAILFWGNNHLIDSNEIRNVCLITSDASAIYTSGDWGARGNVIRSNFIHDVISPIPGYGVFGIYIDDGSSGPAIYNNIFYNISNVAINCGGGRDVLMYNNIIANSGLAHLNEDRVRYNLSNVAGSPWNLLERFTKDGIKRTIDPWLSAFPECAVIPNDYATVMTGLWCNPEGCVFSNNIGWGNLGWVSEINRSGTGVFSVYKEMAGNVSNTSALFSELSVIDRGWRVAQLAPAIAGFNPIPFKSIGRIETPYQGTKIVPNVGALNLDNAGSTDTFIAWSDFSNIAANQESGFTIERRNLPDGLWEKPMTSAPDSTRARIRGLAASTPYEFRIRSGNTSGSDISNIIQVTTNPGGLVESAAQRNEFETGYTVLADVGLNGKISVATDPFTSQGCLRMYDKGDSISKVVSLSQTGSYRFVFRARCGSSTNPVAYANGAYVFRVDGVPITLTLDTSTVTALDANFGGAYWGSWNAGYMQLSAGTHTFDVTTANSWCVVDYFDYVYAGSVRLSLYSAFQAQYFATDQIANASISGAAATPVKDGYSNLLKYALGANPWVYKTSPGTATLGATTSTFTWSKSNEPTDIFLTAEYSSDGTTWQTCTTTVVSTSGKTTNLSSQYAGGRTGWFRIKAVYGASSFYSPAKAIQ